MWVGGSVVAFLLLDQSYNRESDTIAQGWWVGTFLFPTMVCHKPCEMLAKSKLMRLAVKKKKKCLYSDLTLRLSYCSFCKFRLWSSQRHCKADKKLGMLRYCWACLRSPFQAEHKANQQWDTEYSEGHWCKVVLCLCVPSGWKLSMTFLMKAQEGGSVHLYFLRVGKVEHQVFLN